MPGNLKEVEDGVVMPVQVVPGSRKDSIEINQEGRIIIHVRAPADKGKANRAVIKLISKRFSTPSNQVSILRGTTTRDKIVKVKGVDLSFVENILQE